MISWSDVLGSVSRTRLTLTGDIGIAESQSQVAVSLPESQYIEDGEYGNSDHYCERLAAACTEGSESLPVSVQSMGDKD